MIPAPFDEAVAQALAMSDQEVAEKLHSLALDPRWPALLAMVARQQAEAEAMAVSPKAAANYGLVAHAAGALYQAKVFMDLLSRCHRTRSAN